MEYLKSTESRLKTIKEGNIQYINVSNHPNIVFGNPFDTEKVNFTKYTPEIMDEMKEFGDNIYKIMKINNDYTCGNRIRFTTTSRRIVFKVELKRHNNYKNIVAWNANGFDVHIVDEEGNYSNYSLVAPKDGYRIFAEQIVLPPKSSVCIFLPNFNAISKMYIGIEEGSRIAEFPYPKENSLPILFYGNSITEGASASKSGNSFPNIVSRILNHDIINMSMIGCCRGTPKTAEMIGNIDCEAIVIDYSKYASNKKYLEKTHESFYNKIREKHPDKKIIIMTTACFNNWKEYDAYDEVIIKTYENAVSRGDNTYLLNQKELFSEYEYDLIAIDIGHYTDYGMYVIADKICEILKS